jgi:hypothetical protein
MIENETVIPSEELAKIEVSCKCGSSAVFAFKPDTVHTNEQRYGKGPAQSCPNCNEPFGDSVIKVLSMWHQLVSFAQGDAKFSLKFHVPQSSNQPEKS